MGPFQFAMINPVITKKKEAFQTEEGCLSLDGVRPCTRYKEIEVDYLDQNFKKQHGTYTGWTAQIIQHEIDHLNGILFVDYLSPLKRQRIKEKLVKYKKQIAKQ